ncbi:MAG: TonB-dependent receptor, partial [Bacteroidota bacterium]
LGARIDANNYSDDMSNPLEQFSPRASLAFAITDRFFFNANAGRYYQLPPYTVLGYREDGLLVNRENNIRFIQADHLVAGFEWNTETSSKITVEGYYKWYENYPFLLRDSITLANLGGDFGVIGNEPAVSRSSGRTYGMEFLFQQRLYKGFYGIGSYTLGVSEFEDKNGNLVPTSWDARHIVNITLGKKFKKDWEVGINWRFQTGLPYTPPTEDAGLVQVWNVANRALPDFEQINTLRAPASNTLDIRVDKKWFFEKWSLNIYVDVENVTANTVAIPTVVLDRPLDENNTPIGSGVIANPEAPIDQQRYLLKELAPGVGVPIPSIGLMVEL